MDALLKGCTESVFRGDRLRDKALPKNRFRLRAATCLGDRLFGVRRLRRGSTELAGAITLLALFAFSPARGFANQFLPEERVTSDTHEYQMTLNPNHSMDVDANGVVHLVFWEGGLETSLRNPSAVWYCRREPNGSWSPPVMVDNSHTSGGARLGGRHPSLVVLPDGTVHVFWHDYRHCTASGKWIDNIEIYMDTCPPGGSFSETDVRLTSTTAGHSGDNGYLPKAVAAPDGTISLAWYDYHFDPEVADIFLMRSDTQGRFDPQIPLASHRITTSSLQPDGTSFAVPDPAIDAAGYTHLTWTTAFQAGSGIQYARLDPQGLLVVPPISMVSINQYLLPPQIVGAPAGDIYLTSLEGTPIPEARNLAIRRLRPGAADFDDPVEVVEGDMSLRAALRIEGSGLLHIAYTGHNAEFDAAVFHRIYNADMKTILSDIQVSVDADSPQDPCIALDRRGNVYIAWVDYRHANGQVYFRTNVMQSCAVRNSWPQYSE